MGTVVLKNVWKMYGSFEAVKGANAIFNEGEFVSFLGPSGCGKTSTLRMIAGLEEISRGEVYIDNILVNKLEARDRNIAMAFETYALYPHLSVYENIAFPLRVRKISESEIKKRVKEVTDALGIAKNIKDFPKSLSGGVQQRVGLARAIIRPASVYLLDEVLSHLDAVERTLLRGEIRRLQQLQKLTTIFVTHDQLEALAMSDRIIVMNEGVIQQIGTPDEIYDRPANLFVANFVGEPPVNTIKVSRILDNEQDYLLICGQKVLINDMGLHNLPSFKNFILGIRPKHIEVFNKKVPGSIQGKVYTFENLCDYALLSVRLEEGVTVFIITTADANFKLDEVVYLKINPNKVLFYDSESGNLI